MMNCECVNYVHVKVPMRDGVNLCCCVYLPVPEKPRGVILIRSPYNVTGVRDEYAVSWCKRGFACVGFDTRGRYLSEGVCDPGRDEIDDGYDCAEWISKQPWCNGKIVILGGSYIGVTTISGVASGHPAIVGGAPSAITADWYETFYTNGVLELSFMMEWYLGMCVCGVDLGKKRVELGTDKDFKAHLPVRKLDEFSGMTIPQWKRITEHPDPSDAYWQKCSLVNYAKNIHAPMYIRTSYFDLLGRKGYKIFTDLIASPDVAQNVKKQSFLVVGPWGHGVNMLEGSVNYGPSAIVQEDEEIDFITARLEGRESMTDRESGRVRYFTMVENQWHSADTFPPEGTRDEIFYFESAGSANTRKGDGILRRITPAPGSASDHFVYNPADPVPTCGGRIVGAGGQRDQSEIEMRKDVLVYTSPALAADWNVTGIIRAVLYVSSSAPDTDFTVKIVDVSETGVPLNLCDTIQRVRACGGLLKKDEIRRLEFDVDFTSYIFRKGHSIRAEISSSNFPHYERNLNTGRDNPGESEMVSAEQTLHHSAEYPSCVILPVL